METTEEEQLDWTKDDLDSDNEDSSCSSCNSSSASKTDCDARSKMAENGFTARYAAWAKARLTSISSSSSWETDDDTDEDDWRAEEGK